MADERHCETCALSYKVLAECSTTKARAAILTLPHYEVETPVFMPVGTQGTMKGLTSKQLTELDCQIILGNTYHLGMRPGTEILEKAGGLHEFMNWKRALLTDSGGFQMVSLLKLAEITEVKEKVAFGEELLTGLRSIVVRLRFDNGPIITRCLRRDGSRLSRIAKKEGVKFQSPHDGKEMLLTPEKSTEIQNSIGADIIMQLDDVVSSTTTGPRVEEAMLRSIRWLDRCISAHAKPTQQNLFAIIQGGLNLELRKTCIKEMVQRNTPGIAIGGLSGGEEKSLFWKTVTLCTDHLPKKKPRYLMGVGYAVDLVVCCALGVDMFDCVYPTRTARFGTALVPWGQLHLKNKQYSTDFEPIDRDCRCLACKHHTRAYVNSLLGREEIACHLLTIHNIYYQMKLMRDIRESIKQDKFPEFVHKFMKRLFPDEIYPIWVREALASVSIFLNTQETANSKEDKLCKQNDSTPFDERDS